jgi:hypothetical protein
MTRLTVREYPNIDEPIVSVRTDLSRRLAEIIETQVTQILENSIAGIEGIEIISSTSRQERSNISVRFRPMSIPTSPPPMCATASAACAAACRPRSTSRSSPRSRPTPSRSCICR